MPSVRRDVVYNEPLGYRPLVLDLHMPDDQNPPVVLFVHGGGWRAGSRRTFWPGRSEQETFGRITATGWAVASVDYRLTGEAVWPAQIDDVMAAIDWLCSSGVSDHGIDASRLVTWGESAGAQLAAIAGLRDRRVKGVIDWYGPADLRTMPGSDRPDTREAALLGGPASELRSRATDASPLAAVTAAAPPFHIAHGTSDSMVPSSQSESFARALSRAGADVTLQWVPEADHLWKGLHEPAVVFDPALDFLTRLSTTTA